MKLEDVEKLEKTMGQLEGLHREISALAKKSANDGLNKFKLKFVNAALAKANDILGSDYTPMDDFEQFDVDELPSNSDVTFILASYLEEVERMRADNIIPGYRNTWTYNLTDSDERIRTAPPKKIKEKK